MPSTYSDSLRLELIANGEQTNAWGTTTNNNLGTLLEEAIAGVKSITITGNYTLTTANATTDDARNAVLVFNGVLTANATITIPSKKKLYVVRNNTTGSYDLLVKTAAGTGTTVQFGETAFLFCDGSNVFPARQFGTGNATKPAVQFGNYSTGFYTNVTGTELNAVVNNASVFSSTTTYTSFSTKVVTPTPGTAFAGFRLPHGAAPTTPDNGDMWTTTSGAFVQINGATQTFAFASNTNPVSFANGSVGSPSINFSAQTSSGLYYVGTSTVAVSTNGTERMRWSPSGVQFTVPSLAPAGTVSQPSYSFSSDSDTGMYLSSANEVSITTNGTRRGYWTTNAGYTQTRHQIYSASNPIFELFSTGGASAAYGIYIESSSNKLCISNTDGNGNGAGSLYMVIDPASGGLTAFQGVFNNTTGSASNVFVDSSGNLFRSVSARKYKTDIQAYSKSLTDVHKLQPVTYKAKEYRPNHDPEQRFVGFLADDAASAGMEEFVVRDAASGEVEGFQYDRVTALLVNAVKELSEKIDSLQAELTLLRDKS
jgi:hypothetical protein